MLGLLTVALFAAVGSSLWMEGRVAVAVVVLALAGLRLILWARVQWALMRPDEDEAED